MLVCLRRNLNMQEIENVIPEKNSARDPISQPWFLWCISSLLVMHHQYSFCLLPVGCFLNVNLTLPYTDNWWKLTQYLRTCCQQSICHWSFWIIRSYWFMFDFNHSSLLLMTTIFHFCMKAVLDFFFISFHNFNATTYYLENSYHLTPWWCKSILKRSW